MVSDLLETYAADDFNAEAEADIIGFKQPAGMTTARHSEGLWEKVAGCGMVYFKQCLNGILIKGLRTSIRFTMRTYCVAHKEATLYSFGHHATNVGTVQDGSHSPASSMRKKIRSR